MESFSPRTGIDLREYGKVLFKRRWTIATFFFIVLTVITLATFMHVVLQISLAQCDAPGAQGS